MKMELGESKIVVFTVADDAAALGIKGAFFVMDFDPEKADAARALAELQDAMALIRRERPVLADDPILQGFRTLHMRVGVSNRKHVASPENLLALVLAGRDVPSINPIVDLYNSVSLRSRLALGAHDLARVAGPISLRRTSGSETFVPLGAAAPKAISIGEYGYIDEGANRVICRLETRQCESTKVGVGSHSCFFIVQGNAETSADSVHVVTDRLIALLAAYAGGHLAGSIFWLV